VNLTLHRLRERRVPRSRRSPRRQAAVGIVFGIAVFAALVLVYLAVLGPVIAGTSPLLAGFESRSYAPGGTALLNIGGGTTGSVTLQLFKAGGAVGPGAAADGRDKVTFGEPVTAPQKIERPGGKHWLVPVRLGSTWPSGDYVARLTWGGHTDYAPFILRPQRLGTAPVLVVEPTNTWQAYNVTDGDSWYLNPAVHLIHLDRPFAGKDVRGARVPTGLPEQFWRFDLGFLRWYWQSGYRADFVSDDDLQHLNSVDQLHRYRLIVFAGHEEYVSYHVYDLIERYRNAGGNLAFLSANNFFYAVRPGHDTIWGRMRWRDVGRPEARLVGEEYDGWNLGKYPNLPYRIADTAAAPWLFAGTNLHDGSLLGHYGIEIDEPSNASPRGARVLAVIHDAFGPGHSANMTIYTRGRSTVFDAGALNFGASAHWPAVSRLMSNLWSHLSGEARWARASPQPD
jgi:hypothetical protein